MMHKFTACLLLAATAGCAATGNEWTSELSDEVRTRTGAEISVAGLSDRSAVDCERLRALLSEPLTAETAVQVALLNNRSIHALFAEAGVRRAELEEAGLFSNPIASAELRFFDGGLQLEAGLVQSLVNIAFAPRRRRIAENDLESEKARIIGAIVGLAADTRKAFIGYVTAIQREKAWSQAVAAGDLTADLSARLRKAGTLTQMEDLVSQLEQEDARFELASAHTDVAIERERMSELLGLAGMEMEWSAATELPEPVGDVPETSTAEHAAIAASLELRSGRFELEAAAERAGMRRLEPIVGDAEAGVAFEREPDGETGIGPAFSLPVPLFNWGRAAGAAGAWEVRRLEHLYRAESDRIRAAARAARSTMEAAALRAARLRDVIVPLRKKITAETQKEHNAMLVGGFTLFAAKRAEIESSIDYIEAVHEYWNARVELDRILSGVTGDDERERVFRRGRAE